MAQTTGSGTTSRETTTRGTASGGSTAGGMSTGTIDQANPPTSTNGSTTSTDPQSVSKSRGRTRSSTSRSTPPDTTKSGTVSDTMGTGTAGRGPVRGCSESYAKPQPLRRIDRVTGYVTGIAHDQAGPEIVTQTLVCRASRFSMSNRQFRENSFGNRFREYRSAVTHTVGPHCPTVSLNLRLREYGVCGIRYQNLRFCISASSVGLPVEP